MSQSSVRFRLIFVAGLVALCSLVSPAAAQDIQYATFTVEGDTAYMRGELGEPTPASVSALLRDNPGIRRVVMANVPGSEDDDFIIGALMLRERGIETYLPADGLIASGGVDFFLAGTERIVEEGGCVGVHAWQDDDDPTPARDLPRDHPGHKNYLDYYAKIGIDESFYWFTLSAAEYDGMYYMTTEEMLRYGVATKVIPPADGETFRLICDHRWRSAGQNALNIGDHFVDLRIDTAFGP